MVQVKKVAVVLIALTATCNAFWWGESRAAEQPPVKPVPVGYFRAYTYHPFPFSAQSQNPYQQFQFGGKSSGVPLLQSGGSQSSQFYTPKTVSANSYGYNSNFLTSSPAVSGSNSQGFQYSSGSSSGLSNSNSFTQTQSQGSIINSGSSTKLSDTLEMQPTLLPAQSTAQSILGGRYISQNVPTKEVPTQQLPMPLKGQNLVDSTGQYQYITNMQPVTVQHVQFVPCMCPVTMAVPPQDNPEKRTGEQTDDQMNNSVTEQTTEEH